MKKLVKSSLMFALMLSTLLAFYTAKPVHAQSISSVGTDCHARVVRLNGNTSTSTCTQTEAQYQAQLQVAKTGKTTPNISGGGGCSNGNALWIYRDGNGSGPCIAFIGAGTARMYNYTLSGSTTWENQASYFFSGCANGAFGETTNLASDLLYGHGAYFNAFTASNFPYSDSNGTVHNDRLTTILLNNNC